MAEYIEREIAKKAFQDMDSGRRDGWTTSLSSEEAADYLAEYLDDIPTADVAPVKHGEWEEIRDAYRQLEGWMCKKCGRETKAKENYCPNCGAKMDGGENNDR